VEKLKYNVASGENITNFLRTDIKFEPFNGEMKSFQKNLSASPYEHEYHIIYPCREKFLAERSIEKVDWQEICATKLVSNFESKKISLSSFLLTPTHLQCYAKTYLVAPKDLEVLFQVETAGGLKIWVNGKEQLCFAPYQRNIEMVKTFKLELAQGDNELLIYFDDLAERDVNYGFSLKNMSDFPLEGYLPLSFSVQDFYDAKKCIASIYFEKDYFDHGAILFHTEAPSATNIRIRFNPEMNRPITGMQDGNITEFKTSDLIVPVSVEKKKYDLGDVCEYQFASITKVEFGIQLPDGQFLTRIIPVTIFNRKRCEKIITGATITQRKQEALNYYATLDLDDVNVGLCKLFLEKYSKNQNIEEDHAFQSALSLIINKGDCADFVLVPILMFLLQHPEKIPSSFFNKMKEISLEFRYWIDEPGNDVMWYFSENHALLFHIAQYFSGYLFPEGEFSVSGRIGKKQYAIGKERIEEWFNHFFKYGLAEWNSVTYIPIDLIGFFSLYNAAPDKEIQQLSKQALDYIFEIIELNSFQEMYCSTYGRVYEHNLKSITMNELQPINRIAFNKGFFTDSLRAAVLFSLSDYQPRVNDSDKNSITGNYQQGINKATTYLYKTKHFSMASCQAYKVGERGYQQHLLNITLDGMLTSLWINHPGEHCYSGEHRPSYWAGNGRMPFIQQSKENMFIQYELHDNDIPFIHLYYPYWEFSYLEQKENYLLFGNETSGCFLYFSHRPERTMHGPNAFREFICHGKNHKIYIKCFSVKNGLFPKLADLCESIEIIEKSEKQWQVKDHQQNKLFCMDSKGLTIVEK